MGCVASLACCAACACCEGVCRACCACGTKTKEGHVNPAAGRVGSSTDLTNASCSGECEQGYYCEAGSVSAKAAACAEGSYGGAAGLKTQAQCTVCPAGAYCFAGSPAAASCREVTSIRCTAHS